MFKGIHADAKNNWIIAVADALDAILQEPTMAGRRKILERIANGIKGIGEVTIDETLADIESNHYE